MAGAVSVRRAAHLGFVGPGVQNTAKGINPTVINFHTIKPFDVETARQIAETHKLMVSVEEHSVYGGLGTALAEILAESAGEKAGACRLVRLGVQDHFGESGAADELLEKLCLDPEGIAATICKEIT